MSCCDNSASRFEHSALRFSISELTKAKLFSSSSTVFAPRFFSYSLSKSFAATFPSSVSRLAFNKSKVRLYCSSFSSRPFCLSCKTAIIPVNVFVRSVLFSFFARTAFSCDCNSFMFSSPERRRASSARREAISSSKPSVSISRHFVISEIFFIARIFSSISSSSESIATRSFSFSLERVLRLSSCVLKSCLFKELSQPKTWEFCLIKERSSFSWRNPFFMSPLDEIACFALAISSVSSVQRKLKCERT